MLEHILLSEMLVYQGRQSLLEHLGSLHNDLIRSLTTGYPTDTWLNGEDRVNDHLGLLILESDIGVLMQTKDLWLLN